MLDLYASGVSVGGMLVSIWATTVDTFDMDMDMDMDMELCNDGGVTFITGE